MKYVLSAIALSLLLTTAARAEETSSQPVKAEGATEDCSKQVWPTFSLAEERGLRTVNREIALHNAMVVASAQRGTGER